MCTAIKQNEEDRLTNGNPPTLNVPLDAYVAVGLFNKKDTSKDVNPRKACGSPFATNESYICMVTSRHFGKHLFFLCGFNILCRGWFVSGSERRTPESLRRLCVLFYVSEKWASSRHSLMHTADSNEYYAHVLQHTTTQTHKSKPVITKHGKTLKTDITHKNNMWLVTLKSVSCVTGWCAGIASFNYHNSHFLWMSTFKKHG